MATPKVEHDYQMLDLVCVETCSDRGKDERKKWLLEYANQVSDIVIPLDGLQGLDAVDDKKGHYDVLPLSRWICKAVAAGMDQAVIHLFSGDG